MMEQLRAALLRGAVRSNSNGAIEWIESNSNVEIKWIESNSNDPMRYKWLP